MDLILVDPVDREPIGRPWITVAIDAYSRRIAIDWRPLGRPHFGGVVERVIGTLMGLVHALPGTTFSDVGRRGRYGSDRGAA